MDSTLEMKLCKNQRCTCPPAYKSEYCSESCIDFPEPKDGTKQACPCKHQLCLLGEQTFQQPTQA